MRRAAKKYPRAHLPAAMLFECRGEWKQAVSELTAYLENPSPAIANQSSGGDPDC